MDHFHGKDALGHVAEAQARGFLSASEIHGTEVPGFISAAADAARDTAVLLLLAAFLLPLSLLQLLLLATGWLLWRAGRSAWLGWARLERLHRILVQEKWEIEHNRDQEREELGILYASKGFSGPLLEEVLDVLMADGDRLLRVMVEEELGLSLEKIEHPLQQALGAACGTLVATGITLIGFWVFPPWGTFIGALLAIGLAGAISAIYAQNRPIPAVVWTLGIAILAFGAVYFAAGLLQ